MTPRYPAAGDAYVPAPAEPDPPPTIEHVRARGRVVWSGFGRATVETVVGRTAFYCAVTLNDDGTVADFVPRATNRYARPTEEPPCPPTPT